MLKMGQRGQVGNRSIGVQFSGHVENGTFLGGHYVFPFFGFQRDTVQSGEAGGDKTERRSFAFPDGHNRNPP
jgi:hypothetical protein